MSYCWLSLKIIKIKSISKVVVEDIDIKYSYFQKLLVQNISVLSFLEVTYYPFYIIYLLIDYFYS